MAIYKRNKGFLIVVLYMGFVSLLFERAPHEIIKKYVEWNNIYKKVFLLMRGHSSNFRIFIFNITF